MAELNDTDERAADRLTIFMLKELYCSAAHAMLKMNPQAAELLFLGADKLITGAIARVHDQQTEGPHSSEIAVAVGARIAEIMDEAHGVRLDPSRRPAAGGSKAREASEALSAPRDRTSD